MPAHPPSGYCGSASMPGPPLDVPRGCPWWQGLRLSIQWEALYGIICANAINIPYSLVLPARWTWVMDKTSGSRLHAIKASGVRERCCSPPHRREGQTETRLGMCTRPNRTWSHFVVNHRRVPAAGHGCPQRDAEGDSGAPVGDGATGSEWSSNGASYAAPALTYTTCCGRHAPCRCRERGQQRNIKGVQEMVCL